MATVGRRWVIVVAVLVLAAWAQAIAGRNVTSSGDGEPAAAVTAWLGFDARVSLWQLLSVCAVCFVGGAFCSGTGVGGGGFYLPAYIYILGLQSHEAIPLSKATIFGLASAVLCFNLRKRHPHAKRPLIDFGVAQVMEPLSLAGTVLGVLLNLVVPSVIILIVLVAVFVLSGWKTWQKSLSLYHTETGHRFGWATVGRCLTCRTPHPEPADPIEIELTATDYTSLNSLNNDDNNNIDDNDNNNNDEDRVQTDSHNDNDDHDVDSALSEDEAAERQEIERRDRMAVPMHKCWMLIVVWLFCLGLAALRSYLPSLPCGGVGYWSLVAVQIAFPLPFAYAALRVQMSEHLARLRLGMPIVAGDPDWSSPSTSLRASIYSFVAGLLAAFVGVGGGLIKGPVMLELGMIPTVVAATSTFMIAFTASSSSLQYMMVGSLNFPAFALFFCVGASGACCGQLILSQILKRYNKQHVITFLLAAVIFLSGIMFVVSVTIDIVHNGADAFLFSSLCS